MPGTVAVAGLCPLAYSGETRSSRCVDDTAGPGGEPRTGSAADHGRQGTSGDDGVGASGHADRRGRATGTDRERAVRVSWRAQTAGRRGRVGDRPAWAKLPGRWRLHGRVHRLHAPGGGSGCPCDRCRAAQLHQRLRDDRRVTLWEGTNGRALPELPGGISFFAVDVSFISVLHVLASIQERLGTGTEGVVLVKPQFEAGAADVPRGGVIRDPAVRERVRANVRAWATERNWDVLDDMECPTRGTEGNVEYLLHVTTPGTRPC